MEYFQAYWLQLLVPCAQQDCLFDYVHVFDGGCRTVARCRDQRASGVVAVLVPREEGLHFRFLGHLSPDTTISIAIALAWCLMARYRCCLYVSTA